MSFADFERIDQGADKIELPKGEWIRTPIYPIPGVSIPLVEIL